MSASAKKSKSQSEKFADAAREAGCDEDERVWEERLKKVAKPQPKAKTETKRPAK